MSVAVMDAGTPYSPTSPSEPGSSATMSPVYPERPIKPMPRRSLRDRLSPEIADTITYPPVPNASNNMVYPPYTEALAQKEETAIKHALREIDNAMYGSSQPEVDDNDKQNYQFKGNELDSEEEDDMGLIRRYEEEYRNRRGGSLIPPASRVASNGVPRKVETIPQSVASSNESVDGYDSFENTNNKKKRKIPTSATMGNHHPSFSASLSQDLANMGLSNGDGLDNQDGSDGGLGHYYGSGNSAVQAAVAGSGVSGAGRGRYGRSGRRDISTRGPLTSSINSSNAWQNGRLPGPRRDYGSISSLGSKVSDSPSDHGIISQAIAEAAALPAITHKGKENVSLLEQQSSKKPSPANTQFTFTCESDSAKGMVWPEGNNMTGSSSYLPKNPTSANIPQGTKPPSMNSSRKDFNTQGTQTSPMMASQQGQDGAPQQAGAQPQRKPRRSAAKRYAIAARERRTQQEYNNYLHPPKEEDIWICEFCEYESIFGRPPEALVRQYEIKDKRERKRLAEKRRLLEKAKMKGRKGKKGTKNSGKANNNTTQQQTPQANHNPPNSQTPLQNNGTQSEEYFEDEYENEQNMQMPAPPETPSRIPQPVAPQPGQSARVAHTNRPG